MTLPSLIANYEKHVTVVRLQKAYTQVNQVLNSIQAEYGDISIFSQAPSEFVPKYILPHYNGAKMYTAKNNRLAMCYDENNYFLGAPGSSAQYAWHRGVGYLSTPLMPYTVSLKLVDGTCIAFNKFSDATWANVQFFVDVNGSDKGPNWVGRDLFFFQYDKETKSLRPADWNNPNDTCKYAGYGCAAKIMRAGWKIKDDYPCWSKR